MFLPINFEDGKLVRLPMGATDTYTVGEALKISGGYYVAATAAQATDVEAICMEAGTVSASGTLLNCIPTRGVRFIADTDSTPAYSQQGTYVDLAGANTVNEDSAATDYCFYIEKVVGPLADKKVQGFFQHGTVLA
jgi:hypothetical protein